MSNLNRRINKLEQTNHKEPEQVWIQYLINETDGEDAEAEAKAAAIAEWEAKNGPVGDRELNFIVWSLISPKPKPMAPVVDAAKETAGDDEYFGASNRMPFLAR